MMLQDKQLPSPKVKSAGTKWWTWGKGIVTLLIISYIYSTFHQQEKGLKDVFSELASLLTSGHPLSFFFLLGLVPLNWTLESLKWKLLAQKAVPVTFWESFRSTLTGLAIGVAVPAQLGDTLGRISSLRHTNRLETLGAAILSNGIQFYVSVCGGALCWLALADQLPIHPVLYKSISFLLVFIIVAGLWIGASRDKILSWNAERAWLKKLKESLKVIQRYTRADLLNAFLIGMSRYVVIVVQFTIALALFSWPIPYPDLIGCVGLVLLAKTLLPAINIIGDLGLREFTALYVFSPYHLPPEQVVAATFLIWLVNILMPLLVGMGLIWKYKWSHWYA